MFVIKCCIVFSAILHEKKVEILEHNLTDNEKVVSRGKARFIPISSCKLIFIEFIKRHYWSKVSFKYF